MCLKKKTQGNLSSPPWKKVSGRQDFGANPYFFLQGRDCDPEEGRVSPQMIQKQNGCPTFLVIKYLLFPLQHTGLGIIREFIPHSWYLLIFCISLSSLSFPHIPLFTLLHISIMISEQSFY